MGEMKGKGVKMGVEAQNFTEYATRRPGVYRRQVPIRPQDIAEERISTLVETCVF